MTTRIKTGDQPPPPEPAKRRDLTEAIFSVIAKRRELPLAAVMLLLALAVSARVPGYLPTNLRNILKGGAINMVMAAGMLPVLLVGSIDISVASTLAFAGSVAGMLMRDGHIATVPGMFLLGLGIGAACGAVNGVLVAYGGVLPIIVTLGMSYVTRALIPMQWLLGLNKISRTDLTDSFKVALTDIPVLGLPILVWVAVAAALLIGLFLRYTRTGRSLYAVGSNAEAARVRGVRAAWVKTLAHILCGAAAGLAGVMWLGYYNSIEKGTASGDEMYVIAACVLGGVSVTGGYGKMTGVAIGAFMIAMINNAIPQLGIGNSMISEFIKGVLLLCAILLNVLLARVAKRRDLLARRI